MKLLKVLTAFLLLSVITSSLMAEFQEDEDIGGGNEQIPPVPDAPDNDIIREFESKDFEVEENFMNHPPQG